jgi:toxin-antitoxin system PIN domain toxin
VLALDTNVLLYAADQDSEFHRPCVALVESLRASAAPSFLTWNVCYEFVRVATHARVFVKPWTATAAWGFLEALLDAPGLSLLTPTSRHRAVLAQTLAEIPECRGNLVHDLHTAVLLREHGVGSICTRDTDFHRFPFLRVVDPLRTGTSR